MGREHWVEVELWQVAANTKYPIGDGDHGQIKPTVYQKSGVPYIRVGDMGWGELIPKDMVFLSIETHQANLKSELKPYDVLIAKTGATIGKCCIVPESIKIANTTSSVGKVTLNHEVMLPKWLLNFFLTQEFTDFMWSISHRTAQPGFNNRDIEFFKVPLPPLNEQKRIVEKLDTILPKVKNAKARLENIPKILKKFRQSVLSDACSGKLTEEWREGKELPEWENTNVASVIDDLAYGTSQKCDYENNGTPVLRIPNISSGKLDLSDLKYSKLDQKELNKLSLKPGDILVVRSNGSVNLLGQSVMVDDSANGFAYAGYLIRLRCNKEKIYPNYLNIAFKTSEVRSQIELPARSTTGVNNINSSEIKALLIPVPSTEEQHEIVRRVEKLFAIANSLEEKYKTAIARVEKIEQSVLAKAFRGELVEPDPNDEPAEILLKRILDVRAKNVSPQRKPKKRA